MQDSGFISRNELSQHDKLQPHDLRARLSVVTASAIEPARVDDRTRMLLEQPIAPTIIRLAIPNAAVMLVQVLIGLLEVFFVSRLGVDALAGVAPVFPLVSLVLAIAQGALGGGFVTTVARALGTGQVSAASDYT